MLLGILGVDLVKLVFLFSSDIYPAVELLDHMVVLFLGFFFLCKISILFSMMAVPIYIPTNSVKGFPFRHVLILHILIIFWT